MVESVVLSLGSNLGDRHANLSTAVELIGKRCGKVTAISKVYETTPWGTVEGEQGQSAGDFLNQAVAVATGLRPLELLDTLKGIEKDMGRMSSVPGSGTEGQRIYLSRIIDIDIIFYGDSVIDEPQLKVPHPLMAQREFVLMPVAEIAPHTKHPVTGLTAGEMLDALPDSNATECYEEI